MERALLSSSPRDRHSRQHTGDQVPQENLWPEATLQRSLVRVEEERHCMEALALTTSCAIYTLWPQSPLGSTLWNYSVKQLENTSASHSRTNYRRACGAAGALGHFYCCRLLEPFTVNLFIGLLWSSGNMIMVYIGRYLALIVKYIQGNCCCFLVSLGFLSEVIPLP